MTASACGSCGSAVQDATLCTGCTRDLAQLLLLAADIAPDLDDAVAKQLTRGSAGKRSEAEVPLPVDLVASETAGRLRFTLTVWARALHAPPEPLPQPDAASTARWLGLCLPRLRQHHHAGVAFREIRDAVRDALAVVDRRPERFPAGTCPACHCQLYVTSGADSVACECGYAFEGVREWQRERAAAADVLGTPAEISGALERIGIRVPRGTITSWVSRGRLPLRPGNVVALSDVLALHAQRGNHGR